LERSSVLVLILVVVVVVFGATRDETRGPPKKIVSLGNVRGKKDRERAVENKKTTKRDGNGSGLSSGVVAVWMVLVVS